MKSIPFNLILFIVWFLLSHPSFSQNTFEYILHDSTDNLINSAVETTSGQFILAVVKLDEQRQSNVQLIKLDREGILLNNKIFDYQGFGSGFQQILQIDPNLFLLIGYIKNAGRHQLWFWKMDSLFNEIQSKAIPLGTYGYGSANVKTDSDGNILCFGFVTDSVQHPSAFIYKLSPNGDSLRFKVFTSHHALGKFDLLEKPQKKGYIFVVNGFGAGGDILDLDTLFSIKQAHYVPNDFMNYHNLRWINPNSFYLTGEKVNMVTGNRKIGVEILDTSYSVIHVQFLGNSDTTVYFPGLRTILDFFDLNTTYIGGTSDFYPEEFAPVDCWYFLNRVDTNLNIQWQKFYGGDANYTLYGILATRDEGCLMYGTLYDKDPQRLKRDIYVLKVNKDGVLVSTDESSSPKVKEIILFPNPGADKVFIRTAMKDIVFELFDLNGRCLLRQEIGQATATADVSRLPCGLYLYRLTQSGAVVDRGKWVKQ